MNLKILSFYKLKESLKRFPLSVISALIMALAMIVIIEFENNDFEYLEEFLKVIIVTSLGVFMFTALKLLKDKNPLCLVGVVALVVYYLVLDDVKDPSSIIFERHLFLSLMFFLMIFWAPFFKDNPTNEEFWDHTNKVIFAFFTSILFSIILYAGLSGALYAVDSLFSLQINSKRYGQLIFLIIGLFSVNYFLSQIPEKSQITTKHTYTKVENIFTRYILTPLTVGYFIILYAYSAKVLITGVWPKGVLAWFIVAFSLVALVTYLFWTPLWSEKFKAYKRWVFLALLPQTLLLFVAIGMRIEAYSWSEHRYMVLLFGVWLFGVSLYFLLFKNARYKWIFIALSTLLLISQVSPINAYTVSKNAQIKRLTLLLNEHKDISNKSDIDTRYAISSTIEYLYSRFGTKSMSSIMPKIIKEYEDNEKKKKESDKHYYGEDFSYYATDKLGFDYVSKWDMLSAKDGNPPPFPTLFDARYLSVLDIKGYDWLLDLHFSIYENMTNDKIEDINTTFELNDENLTIKEGNDHIKVVSIAQFLQNKKQNHRNNKQLEFLFEDENISLKIMFIDIIFDSNKSISDIYAKAMYRKK